MQIAAGEAEAVTVGNGLTVTETLAVPVHPAAEVPVTVYVVVEDGFTTVDVPLPPELQLYVLAPEPVRVELSPLQIAAGDAEAVTVGSGFTVTVTVVVPEHPNASVPVTEYVVVLVGATEYGFADDPVFHA